MDGCRRGGVPGRCRDRTVACSGPGSLSSPSRGPEGGGRRGTASPRRRACVLNEGCADAFLEQDIKPLFPERYCNAMRFAFDLSGPTTTRPFSATPTQSSAGSRLGHDAMRRPVARRARRRLPPVDRRRQVRMTFCGSTLYDPTRGIASTSPPSIACVVDGRARQRRTRSMAVTSTQCRQFDR